MFNFGKKTLLKKALEIDSRKNKVRITPYNREEIELAMAWARSEVTNAQVSRALGTGPGMNLYIFLARALRQSITENQSIEE